MLSLRRNPLTRNSGKSNQPLYFLLSGLWQELTFEAVLPHSHGFPLPVVCSPVSRWRHPFSGVSGLRKDQTEKNDEKAKSEKKFQLKTVYSFLGNRGENN